MSTPSSPFPPSSSLTKPRLRPSRPRISSSSDGGVSSAARSSAATTGGASLQLFSTSSTRPIADGWSETQWSKQSRSVSPSSSRHARQSGPAPSSKSNVPSPSRKAPSPHPPPSAAVNASCQSATRGSRASSTTLAGVAPSMGTKANSDGPIRMLSSPNGARTFRQTGKAPTGAPSGPRFAGAPLPATRRERSACFATACSRPARSSPSDRGRSSRTATTCAVGGSAQDASDRRGAKSDSMPPSGRGAAPPIRGASRRARAAGSSRTARRAIRYEDDYSLWPVMQDLS